MTLESATRYGRRGTRLPAMLLEMLLDFKCSRAARSCGRNRLPVTPVLDIAAGKDPRHPGKDKIVGLDVAVFVEVDLSLEHAGIRDMPDAQKQPADGERRLHPCDRIAQPDPADFLLFH